MSVEIVLPSQVKKEIRGSKPDSKSARKCKPTRDSQCSPSADAAFATRKKRKRNPTAATTADSFSPSSRQKPSSSSADSSSTDSSSTSTAAAPKSNVGPGSSARARKNGNYVRAAAAAADVGRCDVPGAASGDDIGDENGSGFNSFISPNRAQLSNRKSADEDVDLAGDSKEECDDAVYKAVAVYDAVDWLRDIFVSRICLLADTPEERGFICFNCDFHTAYQFKSVVLLALLQVERHDFEADIRKHVAIKGVGRQHESGWTCDTCTQRLLWREVTCRDVTTGGDCGDFGVDDPSRFSVGSVYEKDYDYAYTYDYNCS